VVTCCESNLIGRALLRDDQFLGTASQVRDEFRLL